MRVDFWDSTTSGCSTGIRIYCVWANTLEQSDGTSWMATYSLNLLRIAAELAVTNKAYNDIASKFFEHFIYIAGAMSNLGTGNDQGLWDEAGRFLITTRLRLPDNTTEKMRIRSLVGLIPLFAAEVLTCR